MIHKKIFWTYLCKLTLQDTTNHSHIISKTKDDEIVKYALNCSMSPTMVAEYKTKLMEKSLQNNDIALNTYIRINKDFDKWCLTSLCNSKGCNLNVFSKGIDL